MNGEWVEVINQVWVQVDKTEYPMIRIYEVNVDQQVSLSVPEFHAIVDFIKGELD